MKRGEPTPEDLRIIAEAAEQSVHELFIEMIGYDPKPSKGAPPLKTKRNSGGRS